jgi:hypothetical protein
MHRVFCKIESALRTYRSLPIRQQAGEFLQESLIFIGHPASVFRGHLHSLRHTFLVRTKRFRIGAG